MTLNRPCPFCGWEEQELKVTGTSSPEGVPTVVACSLCGASTHPIYCGVENYNAAVTEWKEGSIYNTYVSRIKNN